MLQSQWQFKHVTALDEEAVTAQKWKLTRKGAENIEKEL